MFPRSNVGGTWKSTCRCCWSGVNADRSNGAEAESDVPIEEGEEDEDGDER